MPTAMAVAATTTMATDTGLLQLMWLASPALPVGGFSYSEVLEAAVEAGLVSNEGEAALWLLDQLQLTLARSELVALQLSIHAWRKHDAEQVRALNQWLLTTRESAELRLQSEQMGKSLLDWLRNHTTAAPADIALLASMGTVGYTSAFALAASATQAPLRECLLAYAFGWAENMMQAAIKSVPLGQSAGQRILSALAERIPTAVDAALAHESIHTAQAFAPMLAILSAQHEVQYSRLFRS
ncbi:urease accessory protein UreF [Curvibacter sp. CHRR-16]|uniref:urease accessory protein UreF n=1 Tax=Curvibacter sp. CHRR-16 TaxID=2835872 RepID=UPI001BD9D689|nr:urease accessory UreF family protein [Curvibacter sp. CHRR-16]MBT0570890.1 urease accessory protein UreF [Curvibacter sp. CHRR-16]